MEKTEHHCIIFFTFCIGNIHWNCSSTYRRFRIDFCPERLRPGLRIVCLWRDLVNAALWHGLRISWTLQCIIPFDHWTNMQNYDRWPTYEPYARRGGSTTGVWSYQYLFGAFLSRSWPRSRLDSFIYDRQLSPRVSENSISNPHLLLAIASHFNQPRTHRPFD